MYSQKVCHFRVGGNPEAYNYLKTLDSRFHGNDTPDSSGVHISTFYKAVNRKTETFFATVTPCCAA